MKDWLTNWRRALTALVWLIIVAGGSVGLGLAIRFGAATYGVGAWWATVAAVSVCGVGASAFLWLGSAKTWRDPAVKWATIALDVAGFLGTVAYGVSTFYAVAMLRGWIR